jgi:hypothetical protein
VDRGLHKVSLRDPVEACLPGCEGGRRVLVRTPDLRRLRRHNIMEPLLPMAATSAAAGVGPSSPEVASQESEEEDTEEEGSEEDDSAEDDSAEEGAEEEGRLLGSLLEVAGSLLEGER